MKAEKLFTPRDRPTTPRRLYEPLDFAVVRAPVLPVEFYQTTCGTGSSEESLLQVLTNPQLRAAIASTSPSLARALASKTRNPQDHVRALRKLRRYLIRMSTRPTPFGAFAGVGIAPLCRGQTTLRIDETKARQCHYLDVPWLLAFVRRLEADDDIFRRLKLRANPCAFHRGGRIYIRETNPLCPARQTTENASVRATKQVTRALDLAQSPISFETLATLLAESTTAAGEKIHRFIVGLWRQEFLLTDLRPPLTNGDPAQYLLRRLAEVPGSEAYQRQLEDASVAKPGNAPIAASPRSAARRGDGAESVAAPAYRVETVFPVAGNLHIGVAEEAARAAELLLSITSWPQGPPYLQTYRTSFEARYGSAREVPLLEMIDPEFGIGAPIAYDSQKVPPAAGQSAAWRVRRDTLFEIARRANDERRPEVVLDAKDIDRLRTWTPDVDSAPASLEINVFVCAPSTSALDQGQFTVVVGPNVGAMEAGRSLGRFAQPLGECGARAYARAASAHEQARLDGQCVELSYLPHIPQLANILVRTGTRPFEIAVGLQPGVPFAQSIPVSELRVGVHRGRFYLRSPRFPGDLRICSGHMANMEFAPVVCRVLADLMLDGVATLRDFDWGVAAMHHFLPRVRVGRTVLSVAKWRITEAFLHSSFSLDGAREFRHSLDRWRTERNVPRYVHMTETDNRLVLDLENDTDIADLRDELRQVSAQRLVTLEEVYPRLEDAWLRGVTGRFVAEYVVPLVVRSNARDDRPSRRPHAACALAASLLPSATDRMKAPGSDWLYFKLYGASSLEDDLLTGPIRELTCWVRESAAAQRWFFVRYADPQPHIRLRFQGEPGVLADTLLPKALSWVRELVEKELCLRFALDSYEREIERYGGICAITAAEDLFFHDSEFALTALSFLEPRCPLQRYELAMVGLHALFRDLGWDLPRRAVFFKALDTGRYESGIACRERKEICEALAGLRPELPVAAFIRRISHGVRTDPFAVLSVGRRLQVLDDEGALCVPVASIFRSFAHMHCNRLGLGADAERLAYGVLTRTYETARSLAREQLANVPLIADTAMARYDA